MAKTNLSNHLFLLAATTSVVALLVGFAPPETDKTKFDLQVPLQVTSKSNVHPEVINNQLPIETVLPHRYIPNANAELTTNDDEAEDNNAFNIKTIINLSPKSNSSEFDTTMLTGETRPNFETHTKTIESGDSIYKILSPYGVSNSDIYEISLSDTKTKELNLMQPGQTLTFDIEKHEDKALVKKVVLQKSLLEQVVLQRKMVAIPKTPSLEHPKPFKYIKKSLLNTRSLLTA